MDYLSKKYEHERTKLSKLKAATITQDQFLMSTLSSNRAVAHILRGAEGEAEADLRGRERRLAHDREGGRREHLRGAVRPARRVVRAGQARDRGLRGHRGELQVRVQGLQRQAQARQHKSRGGAGR